MGPGSTRHTTESVGRYCSMAATTSSRGLGSSSAVAASDMSGMVKGWMREACHSHSAATASASVRVGSTSGCRAGVLSTRESSITW